MSTVPFSRSRATAIEKPLPSSIDAEKAILGAVLLDNHTLKVAAEFLHAGDFFFPAHVIIFRKMLALSAANRPIDSVTLTEEMYNEGELGTVGGAPYISSLGDGMWRGSNVAHYAKIVREKSALRQLIHKTHDMQHRALEGGWSYDDLAGELAAFQQNAVNRNGNKLVAVDAEKLMLMDLPAQQFIIEPILPVKGIGMIYAWRGVGKTFVTMEIAYCVATGAKCFVWNVPKKRRVIYVDGEMDVETLQDRLRDINKGHDGALPEPGYLQFITPDLQTQFFPKVNTKEGQAAIEKHLLPGDLVILDNLAALCPSSNEDETGDWIMVQEWLLHLRRSNITVLFMHHAGKGGAQRGFSGKEDLINVTINLRRPDGYNMDQQLRAEVHLEKVRGKAAVGSWVQPFEITLTTDEGKAEWLIRPLRELIEKRVFQMFAAGMKPNDVAQDLRLSRYQVYRLLKKFQGGSSSPEQEQLDAK